MATKKSAVKERPNVNPMTGEILSPERLDASSGKIIHARSIASLAVPPPMQSVNTIDKVAGKNPPVYSLKDHPEWAGMDLYVSDVRFGSGEINGKSTDYLIATAWVCPPGKQPTEDNFVLLRTGADNVYQRVAEAFAKNALPIKGTLRRGGRAWFLD